MHVTFALKVQFEKNISDMLELLVLAYHLNPVVEKRCLGHALEFKHVVKIILEANIKIYSKYYDYSENFYIV